MGLLQQNKLFLSRNSTLKGEGYPHKGLNLRGSAFDAIQLVDESTRESFEQMPRDMAYREVFPGAIYTASGEGDHLITYRCQNLDLEQKKATLKPFKQVQDYLLSQIQTCKLKF